MASRVQEGDYIVLRGKVSRVDEGASPDNDMVTAHIDGYGYPITLRAEWVEVTGKSPKAPKARDLGL